MRRGESRGGRTGPKTRRKIRFIERGEVSRERRGRTPKTADIATEVSTPMGADRDALVVSSERWADASKPEERDVSDLDMMKSGDELDL